VTSRLPRRYSRRIGAWVIMTRRAQAGLPERVKPPKDSPGLGSWDREQRYYRANGARVVPGSKPVLYAACRLTGKQRRRRDKKLRERWQ